MTNRPDKERPGISIRGNVEGTGITIGHCSQASVNIGQHPAQAEAAARLDEFLKRLTELQEKAPDPESARECAVAARHELETPAPRWAIARGLLRGAAAGVAGVAALTEIINNVLAVISHLPG